MTYLALPEI